MNHAPALFFHKIYNLILIVVWTSISGLPTLQWDASCSTAKNCSSILQSFLLRCNSNCIVTCEPPYSVFHLLHTDHITADTIDGFTIDGKGARFIHHGNAGFMRISNVKNIMLQNFSVTTFRKPFTFGKVISLAPYNVITISVDMNLYPFAQEYESWLNQAEALFEVNSTTGVPLTRGLDWIDSCNRLPLNINTSVSTLSFPDLNFNLTQGSAVILRHFAFGPSHSLLVLSCVGLRIQNVDLHAGGGMGILAIDTTDITLKHYRNRPEPKFVLATNADAIHLSSCRGKVVIDSCEANSQGDDGLNVHGDVGIIEDVNITFKHDCNKCPPNRYNMSTVLQVVVGKDGMSIWDHPTFRIDDYCLIRSKADLKIKAYLSITSVTIVNITNFIINGSLNMILKTEQIMKGDFIISISAIPSSIIISDSTFMNSRANGLVLNCHNVTSIRNKIINLSSYAVNIGNYFNSFSETTFGSNHQFINNTFIGCGKGHRTNKSTTWGKGPMVRFGATPGALSSNVTVHHNITFQHNSFTSLTDQNAIILHAASIKNLSVEKNTFTRPVSVLIPPIQAVKCKNSRFVNNQCCFLHEPSRQCYSCGISVFPW